MRHADLVEGAWEIGGEIVALRVPRTGEQLTRAIDWLVGSSELTAQATLAGLGALARIGNVDDVFERATRSVGRDGPVDRPHDLVTVLDLIERPDSQG